MHDFRIMALTSETSLDPAVAIAACRAGALGGLNLEHREFGDALTVAVERLDRYAEGPFGVKLGAASGATVEWLLADGPAGLSWVLLGGGLHDQMAEWVSAFAKANVDVFVEAIDIEEAIAAESMGAEAVVLKGHEAAGRAGQETAFILLQRWQQHVAKGGGLGIRAFVQGGIGLHTAAACAAGGAAGAVLDNQLLLARESVVSPRTEQLLSAFDGSQTAFLGGALGETYRIYSHPAMPASVALAELSETMAADEAATDRTAKLNAWRNAVTEHVRNTAAGDLCLIGQDASSAPMLAERYVTVAGILDAVQTQVKESLAKACELKPLAEGAPLAESHATQYPILQGPMTRVSDTAAFANSVAEAGALPFLALALLRKAETEKLLAETSEMVGERSWGVGILGFLPPEIRNEQIEAILETRPPFALIAGGRPDQAKQFEDEGIPTYLHVPSPGLLRMFLKDGATRFVFEGKECGGHVGPRSSFALWDAMCGILLDHLGPNGRGDALHVVFAGGIHDALSASMIAAMAAPLAARGVKVGVLMGTAYLFTEEAVQGGAIVPRFQQQALQCDRTVLLETGPGHAIRCIETPYYEDFTAEKKRLKASGKSAEEITRALEWNNIGRLRVASKGLDRVADESGTSKLTEVDDDEQVRRGMYMIGQLSGMRDSIVSMRSLHEDVAVGGTERLETLTVADESGERETTPSDIAIVGMSSFYPGSLSPNAYWHNILKRHYAVTEIPQSHWDWERFYDKDPFAPDRIVSKWGGFLDDVPFDPFRYGITPKSIESIEPLQLLLLEAVRRGLDDAGYANRPFNRERTSAIIGIGGGGSPLAIAYGFRTCLPYLDDLPGLTMSGEEVRNSGEGLLPNWTEDSFPGILMNVAVGRVANRFNLGGANYAIDAACASSLAALDACVRELESGTSDVAIAMGADTVQTPYAYMAFSKTHALSKRGRCSPFDAAADGIVLSEGIGVVVLKRLADAKRDGDRIYAVIKGVGSSSDGKDKGLTAPNSDGQSRALRRAYHKAGVSPADIELIEAHGTGTVVGDRTEAAALGRIMREAGAPDRNCALGSVKSMIGHSKCAAGIAGLIKTAEAIHRKVLPPTIVDTPNPNAGFDDGPLYLNRDARPWVHGSPGPRRAGVSAFGFGGTNFHVVLEEYNDDYLETATPGCEEFSAESFLFRRATRDEIAVAVEKCAASLANGAAPTLRDLAAATWRASTDDTAHPTLVVVANSLEELTDKLAIAKSMVDGEKAAADDPRGVFFAAKPGDARGKVAFLFPGQGSQYPDMLAGLGVAFSEVRESFDRAEGELFDVLDRRLAQYVYPASAFSDEQRREQQVEIAKTEVAQPAIGAASMGVLRLLSRLGIQGEMFAGHSYGEYVALCAAGAMSEEDLYRVSYQRGRVIADVTEQVPGGMAAVEGDADAVAAAIDGLEGVSIANHNSPRQTVISAGGDALEGALDKLQAAGLRARRIPVSCAFHSSHVAPAREPLSRALRDVDFRETTAPVYSNATADVYPDDTDQYVDGLTTHLTSPVRFADEIEAMYAAGARTFVEVGPHGVLTGLTKQILGDRPHRAVASNLKGRDDLLQFQMFIAQLLVAGVDVRGEELFRGRSDRPFALGELDRQTGQPEYTASTYLVNGVRSRKINDPEPLLLGQRRVRETLEAKMKNNGSPEAVTNPVETRQATAAPASAAPTAPTTPTPTAPAAAPVVRAPAAPAPATSSTPMAPAASDDGATQVMLRYQELMARFLDTQRSVLLSYLEGPESAASHPGPAPLPAVTQPTAAPAPVAQAAPAPAAPAPVVTAPPATANGHAPAETAMVPQAPAAPQAAPPPAVMDTASANGNGHALAPAGGAKKQLSADELSDELLALVSERTGYPKDMLDLDLDLEADLGIDSIKRVEILGTLAESIDVGEGDLESKLELEKLTVIRTLRGILEYLGEAIFDDAKPAAIEDAEKKKSPGRVSTPAPASSESPTVAPTVAAPTSALEPPKVEPTAAAVAVSPENEPELQVQRALVKLVEAPLPSSLSMPIPSGAVLLTDDGRGVATEIADRMGDFGQQVLIVRHADGGANGSEFSADLTDPDSVAALLERVHERVGKVGAFFHLMPLAARNDADWSRRAYRDTKSLYLLARALEDELCDAGKEGNAFLFAATELGGGFGFSEGALPETYSPAQGGTAGFLKCVAMEWDDVVVRCVDFDAGRSVGEVVERLLGEMGDADGPREVGYLDGERVAWELDQAPLDTTADAEMVLEPGATVLITGGARGITSAIAERLASAFQPKLVLVGRSPLPEGAEAEETAALTEPADIKAVLIQRLQKEKGKATPAEVEKCFGRLMRDREIRRSLERMQVAGAEVEYHAIDVRDADAMRALCADVTARHGSIAGVIHGAGVIEDKLVKDKTPESFDRVFGTKVESAYTLSECLDPKTLKFFVLFSSLASRYGNRGQSDYAAANEVLSKLAIQLDRKWDARVVAIAWGPWSGLGMVASLEPHLRRRGLKLITPDEGPEFVLNELTHGRHGESEVVVAGGAERLVTTDARPKLATT